MPYLDLYTTPLTAKSAAHLLRRTTFGPNPAEIAAFTGLTATQAVQTLINNINYTPLQPITLDETATNAGQLFLQNASTPAGEYLPFIGADSPEHRRDIRLWWLNLMVQPGPVNLLDKLTLFWQNHFVATLEEANDYRFVWTYLKLLRDNALGNFRDLVIRVTKEPAMLRYLNGDMNEAGVGKANENYARELQELFTVGAVDFAGEPNYTEDDVKNAAKVLTGWKYSNYYRENSTTFATTFTATKHDNTTKTFSAKYNNKTISTPNPVPAGFANVGEYELSELTTMLLAHPQTARFICRKLYRWYVNPNVSEAIETNVVIPLAALLVSSNWNIRPVLEKLLTSQEFFAEANVGAIIKSPAEFVVGLVRFYSLPIPTVTGSATIPYRKTLEYLYNRMRDQQLDLLEQPTVFGYDPYYQTGYSMLWTNTNTIAVRSDFSDRMTNSQTIDSASSTVLNINPLARVVALQSGFGNITTNTATPPGTPPVTCVQVLDSFLLHLFATDLAQSQKDFLIDTVMMKSIPRTSWEFEWNAYRRTVTFPASYTTSQINNARNAVNDRLRNLMKYLFRMAEYHLF
jgi:uncharacterized protein (DUF1800 family)